MVIYSAIVISTFLQLYEVTIWCKQPNGTLYVPVASFFVGKIGLMRDMIIYSMYSL